jgi:hypothetical protein
MHTHSPRRLSDEDRPTASSRGCPCHSRVDSRSVMFDARTGANLLLGVVVAVGTSAKATDASSRSSPGVRQSLRVPVLSFGADHVARGVRAAIWRGASRPGSPGAGRGRCRT